MARRFDTATGGRRTVACLHAAARRGCALAVRGEVDHRAVAGSAAAEHVLALRFVNYPRATGAVLRRGPALALDLRTHLTNTGRTSVA